jgi:hypothetical protein
MTKKLHAVILISVLVAGCANQRFLVGGEIAPTSAPKYEDRQTYFIGGLAQKQTVDATQVCGGANKVNAVATEITFVDGVLGMLTFGIYTPITARVYCK